MPVAIIERLKKAEPDSDKKVRSALKRYFKILSGEEKPKFKLLGEEIKTRAKEAEKVLGRCGLCERSCIVNRLAGKKGYCGVGKEMLISSYFEHSGEEYFLVPSFTVFFWGCNFSCQYCQNWEVSQRIEKPTKISEARLAAIIDKHTKECKNVNFVGGEPTPQLPFIIKVLSNVKSDIPVVWNSNFYMSNKAIDLLWGLVDVYLSDFKYGNDRCAERLSKVKNYTNVAKRNHFLAAQDSEMVIRHLMLPGHLECCTKPVLEWIADNLKDKVVVNIMDQYRPCWKAFEYSEITRYLKPEELALAVDYAKKLKLNFIS